MQRRMGTFAAALTLACVMGQAAVAADGRFSWGNKVIYGDDNRLDYYQVTKQLHLDLADSTVALVKTADVKVNGDGTSTLTGDKYGDAFNLCSDEPFYEQTAPAFCSGFLVDPETIVTAGHCIEGPADCASTSFVFGFHVKAAGAAHAAVKSEDVYACDRVLRTEVNGRGADFAVIKLKTRVMNHRATELRREGALAAGDEVVVIGHPSGLPTKIAAGAAVRSLHNGYFMANLDTYGGNSGSAVFNEATGKVEGILVRGERDFTLQNGCMVSNRCPAGGCRGEDVTLISAALPHIPSSSVDPLVVDVLDPVNRAEPVVTPETDPTDSVIPPMPL